MPKIKIKFNYEKCLNRPFSSNIVIMIYVIFQIAARYAAADTVDDELEDALRKALTAGIDINHRNDSGLTLLMIACAKGFAQIVRILLSHNADLRLKSQSGETALDLAVRNENRECVQSVEKHLSRVGL